MSEKSMTREEIEDQRDCEEIERILNDPDSEWVEWEAAKNELLRSRREKSDKGNRKPFRVAAG